VHAIIKTVLSGGATNFGGSSGCSRYNEWGLCYPLRVDNSGDSALYARWGLSVGSSHHGGDDERYGLHIIHVL